MARKNRARLGPSFGPMGVLIPQAYRDLPAMAPDARLRTRKKTAATARQTPARAPPRAPPGSMPPGSVGEASEWRREWRRTPGDSTRGVVVTVRGENTYANGVLVRGGITLQGGEGKCSLSR